MDWARGSRIARFVRGIRRTPKSSGQTPALHKNSQTTKTQRPQEPRSELGRISLPSFASSRLCGGFRFRQSARRRLRKLNQSGSKRRLYFTSETRIRVVDPRARSFISTQGGGQITGI